MQIAKTLVRLGCLLVAAGASAAADAPFTGSFKGTGRACNGGVYVRPKTIEWISSWSICKSGGYEVLEKKLEGDGQRIVFHIKARSKQCRYEVLALEQVHGTDWTADGYQSLEAYQKRELPDWRNSPLPERLILECPMTRIK